MFQKIKDIKRKIYIAKIVGIIIGIIFILLIANNIFQQIQIQDLQKRVENLESVK